MAEQISPELFKHLVELAALELDPKESEYLRRELNNQLKAIEELAAIPIPDGTPLASHGVPYAAAIRPGLRADEVAQYAGAADILGQVPETSAGYVVVPEIPHEDLE
jgi:aspartyl-tRNA(Asn)/glutamyl-tRNA(Gln) amidotransferase subunit C